MADITEEKGEAKWYVLKVHSAFDNIVKEKLWQMVEARDLQDYIFDICIPAEKQVRIRNGKRVEREEKIFPGYILIHMILNDQTWYAINNMEHVSGFLGSRTAPESIPAEEVEEIKRRMNVDSVQHETEFQVGDLVRIVDGPFEEFEGRVSEIDPSKGQIFVLVPMFGRETPVKLDLFQVRAL